MKISIYTVIDGHGGDWAAHFIRKRLENEIRTQLNDPVKGIKKYKGSVNECITNALRKTFMIIDEEYYNAMPEIAFRCGATCCCVVIIGNRVFCANVGDSRAVLCRSTRAINLSYDHKTVSIGTINLKID
jgi:protein phosphatase 1L